MFLLLLSVALRHSSLIGAFFALRTVFRRALLSASYRVLAARLFLRLVFRHGFFVILFCHIFLLI